MKARLFRFGFFLFLLEAVTLSAQEASTNRVGRAGRTNDAIARIRDEGLNRSQLSNTLSYLCDVIGPRLTGSPNLRHANEWTRDTMLGWGLTNGALEAWGPFGRGWSLQRFSAQVVEPYAIPLIAAPKAWSPGFEEPLTARVVLLDAKTEAELNKFKSEVNGAIVLVSSQREVKARFEAPGVRINESNLLRLANAAPGSRTRGTPTEPSVLSNSPAASRLGLRSNVFQAVITNSAGTNSAGTNQPRVAASRTNSIARPISSNERFQFAARSGAALVVSSSSEGDGGTLFVASATVPFTNSNLRGPLTRNPSAWSTNNPKIPPQITLASEDYNRLVRMIQRGEKLKMNVDLAAQYHTNDWMAWNTVAEIPGTDLKDEIVMLGGHLDSWHSGTGATDNGAGVATAMEAVRILKALKLQPRRTIRVGLWTGEEQGLLGSTAYVREHFGYFTNITNTPIATAVSPKGASEFARVAAAQPSDTSNRATNRVTRKLVRRGQYDKFSAYFNLDNGSGKIRGVYMQGNEAVRPLFRQWLEPFRDLGAETLTIANTGGTDHLPFDAIGLPGFQFIQDPIEYWTRTHHSNADVFDRIQIEDLKQASVIMASFVYNAAMADEKVPRKELNEEPATSRRSSRDASGRVSE
jgi:carboxypeptidase Q